MEFAEVVVDVGIDNRHDLTKYSSLFEELSRLTKIKMHLELFRFCIFSPRLSLSLSQSIVVSLSL